MQRMTKDLERARLPLVDSLELYVEWRAGSTCVDEVKVNQKNPVRENEEFIVSCIAQGSSHMTFTWFKDGVFVNHSKSIRNMWTKLIPMGSEDQYNAMLGIESATPLDAGWYTCQVVDLEVQQCKSVYVEVLSQPQVKISPMSVAVERGEDVTVKCMSTSSYQRHEKYGYNWTKNKALFPMMRNKIIWEDLYPSGSILKIFKAQKSAIFDCQVQGSVASNSASVTVEVVNKSVVALTAVPCPATHAGRAATRRCVLTDTHRASWQRPDFSQCRRPALAHIHRKQPPAASPAASPSPTRVPGNTAMQQQQRRLQGRTVSSRGPSRFKCRGIDLARHRYLQFQANGCKGAGFILLTLGYQNTTGAETLADTLALLKKLTRLLPGEGEQVLDLLHDVQSYLNQTNFLDDILASVNDFYEIISILLDNPFSIQNPEKIVQLQELVNQESIIWGSFLIPMKTYKLQLSSIELIVSPFKTTSLTGKTFQKHFTSTSTTVINKMTIYIDALKRRAYLNGTYCIAVVIYRNLTRFLPARYSCKMGDGTEMEYEINSQVVTVQLGHGRSLLHPAPGTFQVDLEMEQVIKEYNPLRWKSTCAVTSVAQVEHSWNIEGCKTHTGANNISSCRCYQPGSFAILMTSHNAVLTSAPTINQHLIPLVGCIVCLLQTMMTLVLLLPHWWYHQNCLVFLKLQCSLAVMAAMITFVYVFQGSVGKEFFPYVTTSLEAFMLIGNSSHISKLLIVYTEVVKIPKVKHLKQTVICIITGVPVLALLCSHLVHHSTDWNLNSWWLIIGSTTFNIFITSITIMLLLFAFLYFMVIRKLSNYSRERHSGTKSVKYRTGLLKRAGIIFLMMVIVEISSILYINLQTVTYHYVFSVSTSLLGFSVLVCYIISSECPLHTKLLHKLKLVKTTDVDFSSESLNSPLRCKYDPY
ncbi:adhesion G protein-coupled receptor L4-like [Schistocerca americana]|uniref:adhesion G protein-coupled receptor L4-like n=1 Tax=Schistocerca americana TaxID=7009 RepID=UPI001F4FC0E7|nr:adhesion G protein-coupled receptor L4-like [Schistocerca americana]